MDTPASKQTDNPEIDTENEEKLPAVKAAAPRSVLEFAWAEWDLIQKKVDSVSNFPFTVKAWSITVAGALIGFGKGFNFPIPALAVTLAIPFVFKAIESRHNAIRDTLGLRAEALERLIDRLMDKDESWNGVPRSLRRKITRLPGVALSLIQAKNDLDKWRWSFSQGGDESVQSFYRDLRMWWHRHIVPRGDALFYILQFLLLGFVLVGLYLTKPKVPGELDGKKQDIPKKEQLKSSPSTDEGASGERPPPPLLLIPDLVAVSDFKVQKMFQNGEEKRIR